MLQRECAGTERVPLRVSSGTEAGGIRVTIAWQPDGSETAERADALCGALAPRLAQLGLWIEATNAACIVHIPTSKPAAGGIPV
jgi:hypothetical protein